MVKSQIQAEIHADLAAVWALVTDVSSAAWRSDVKKIEVVQAGSQFIEYAKDGTATAFTVTAKHPYQRYEFTMENKNLSGRWTGRFTETGGRTQVIFTEYITVKKFWMRPFAKRYLKKQQARYIEDIKRALGV